MSFVIVTLRITTLSIMLCCHIFCYAKCPVTQQIVLKNLLSLFWNNILNSIMSYTGKQPGLLLFHNHIQNSIMSYSGKHPVSISLVFYEQIFCMKVFCTAFMCLQLGFAIFWQKDFGTKAAHKMLVKLTPGILIQWVRKEPFEVEEGNVCHQKTRQLISRK